MGVDVLFAETSDGLGLDLWPASALLCEQLLGYPELIRGRRVLELGSGVGLVGLLAARAGAAHVTLSDNDNLVGLRPCLIVID